MSPTESASTYVTRDLTIGGNVSADRIIATTLHYAGELGANETLSVTVAGRVSSLLQAGNYLEGDAFNGSSGRIWNVQGSVANVPVTLVARNETGTVYVSDLVGNVVGTVDDLDFRIRTDGTDRVRITSDGNVGIGTEHTPSPAYQLDVQGTIHASGDVILFSDARYKTDVRPIERALDAVERMRGVRYRWIDGDDDRVHVGLLAQEVEAAVPEAVTTDPETDRKSVAYPQLVGVLVSAVNELRAETSDLRARLDRLESNRDA